MVFDNYVYMTICEVTLDLFKETNFSTYGAYCRMMKLSLSKNDSSYLDKKDMAHLMKIDDVLINIFSMDSRKNFDYIINYFLEEKYVKFELVVREMFEFYPLVGRIDGQ